MRVAADALARRALQACLALIVLSVVAFALPRIASGDPTVALYGADASAADRASLRTALGLDGSLAEQYSRWIAGAIQGDLGNSLRDGRPSLALVLERLPATVALAFSALSLGLVGGIALGLVASMNAGTRVDKLATALAAGATAAPGFWVGLLLAYVFAYRLGWLPFGGSVGIDSSGGIGLDVSHLLLPSLALGIREIGRVAILLRAGLVAESSLPYARVAASKGLSQLSVMIRHALPNALFPVAGSVGVSLAYLLGGAVAVETVFAWPGVGRLMADAAASRDFPVLGSGILVAGICALAANLLADMALVVLDPRGKSESEDAF